MKNHWNEELDAEVGLETVEISIEPCLWPGLDSWLDDWEGGAA
ncbi:MAG: hypothetical protein ACXWQO_02275 [Bdellovibrionota bacterium]